MRAGIVGLVLSGAVMTVACGAEDIELAESDAGTDAGRAGGRDGGAVEEAGRFLGDAAPSGCDASGSSTACRALGDPCDSSSDCCSTRCASNACVPRGTCAGAGSSCASAADCCSARCEPVSGSTARECLAECRPTNTACAQASDCCSLACNAGACGGAECQTEGSDCTSDAQCCSNHCDGANGNKCILDTVATCRPSGEDCTSGGKAPCCGGCDDSVQRCGPGAGACRIIGSICGTDLDCCHGTCAASAATGERLCTSALLADGEPCQAGFECLNGSCVGNTPVCGSPAKACTLSGSACTTSASCCSGRCGTDGTCQAGCVPLSR